MSLLYWTQVLDQSDVLHIFWPSTLTPWIYAWITSDQYPVESHKATVENKASRPVTVIQTCACRQKRIIKRMDKKGLYHLRSWSRGEPLMPINVIYRSKPVGKYQAWTLKFLNREGWGNIYRFDRLEWLFLTIVFFSLLLIVLLFFLGLHHLNAQMPFLARSQCQWLFAKIWWDKSCRAGCSLSEGLGRGD